MKGLEELVEDSAFWRQTGEEVLAVVGEVRRLKAQQLELLRLVEEHNLPRCFACNRQLLSEPHKPDCELVALLGREPKL
jgi:hypothetical protein